LIEFIIREAFQIVEPLMTKELERVQLSEYFDWKIRQFIVFQLELSEIWESRDGSRKVCNTVIAEVEDHQVDVGRKQIRLFQLFFSITDSCSILNTLNLVVMKNELVQGRKLEDAC
jgi:hypothetical protein